MPQLDQHLAQKWNGVSTWHSLPKFRYQGWDEASKFDILIKWIIFLIFYGILNYYEFYITLCSLISFITLSKNKYLALSFNFSKIPARYSRTNEIHHPITSKFH